MQNLELLDDLCEVLTDGSLCALGGLIPLPVQSAIRHFPEDFHKAAPPPPANGSSKAQETQSWR
jgi:formate dehydrogenase iron-sulfur subunit